MKNLLTKFILTNLLLTSLNALHAVECKGIDLENGNKVLFNFNKIFRLSKVMSPADGLIGISVPEIGEAFSLNLVLESGISKGYHQISLGCSKIFGMPGLQHGHGKCDSIIYLEVDDGYKGADEVRVAFVKDSRSNYINYSFLNSGCVLDVSASILLETLGL